MAGRYERALRTASSVLNRLLAADEALGQGVAELEGARVLLQFTSPELALMVSVTGGQFELEEGVAHPSDVVITGSVAEFLQFAKARRAGQPTPSGLVRISGDLAVAERMQRLLSASGIDWERLLAGVIGDVPTHWLSSALRGSGARAGERLQSLKTDVREYLLYEARWLPDPEAFAEYAEEVRALRAAVDRLEARINLRAEAVAADAPVGKVTDNARKET